MKVRTSVPVALVVTFVSSSACRTSETANAKYSRSTVGVANLAVPKAWTPQLESNEPERRVWSPAAGANDAKETLAIRIAPRRPQMSDEAVLAVASDAQGVLPGVKVLASRTLTTRTGLRALWVETSFVPRGSQQPYHRVHVTALGKTHVFHLFYTALTPDPSAQVLREAVDSLKEEG